MTPEPNDRTPLDFTRELELGDGTEVVRLGRPTASASVLSPAPLSRTKHELACGNGGNLP